MAKPKDKTLASIRRMAARYRADGFTQPKLTARADAALTL
jgi:hypothetical protein